MRTPKQIAASRANGAKSKGPVTPEGKRNSSKNATKHGLLAETVVLEQEDEELFVDLVEDLIEEHQPATSTEKMLVETLAVARWRQDRIWGLQKTAFDRDIDANRSAPSAPVAAVQALTNADTIRTHELLLRYEVALDRQMSRALLRLLQLQSRRQEKADADVGQVSNLRPISNRPTQKTPPSTSPSTQPDPPAVVVQVPNRPTKKTPTTKQTHQPNETHNNPLDSPSLCHPQK